MSGRLGDSLAIAIILLWAAIGRGISAPLAAVPMRSVPLEIGALIDVQPYPIRLLNWFVSK